MNGKVTKVRPPYPQGETPNLCVPEKSNEYHPFLLGRLGANPLVVICMNLSAANEEYSDRAINRIINTSKKLGHDGWLVANVYPERATSSSSLDEFDAKLAEENVRLIIEFLLVHGIYEVWGAWGNLAHPSLVKGRDSLLSAFRKNNISVYSFAPVTKRGQPVHPLNRSMKQDISEDGKKYLDI